MPAPQLPSATQFFSAPLLDRLDRMAEPSPVPGLRLSPGLRQEFPRLLTDDALRFVVTLCEAALPALAQVLRQRMTDRAWLDAQTLDCARRNEGRGFLSQEYETVIGKCDDSGRLLLGPLPPGPTAPVEIPNWLRGEQVTLFGPPDTRKMSINAMNALHRRLPDEAPIVAQLVQECGQVPRWGADDEDSKTPLARDLLHACENLIGCFDGTLTHEDPNGRRYSLSQDGLALPIKRIPGLALPDGSWLLHGEPLPLHLVDLGLHLFHNHKNPRALVFYIPKLENEEEAAYLKQVLSHAESLLRQKDATYTPGTIKLFIVFENPRAIFRIREIAQALHPHFVGGSLGWHDFLASTARLFRHDPNYRIPVKADPNIVIDHIKESHQILARCLGPMGALCIGGMYGILYEDGNQRSFLVSMVGFIKDVITQMKRGLNGYWVAHPSFVRVGIALVAAWRRKEKDPQDTALEQLIRALVPDEAELSHLLPFVAGPDVKGLSEQHPLYLRGVLAADLPGSTLIANNHPDEIRYNVFQALQYLADWLCGNGCVALPAVLRDARGEPVFVRVMDDLATTERSRWELWAELHHGRFARSDFEAILQEEIGFLRADQDSPTHRIQVRWRGEAARWYPVAERILRQLATDHEPVEFVTELLMPFTAAPIREADDPWAAATALCPGRYRG